MWEKLTTLYGTKNKAKYKNAIEWQNEVARLMLTAEDVFEWSGFPDTINTRFLEACALIGGRVLIGEVDGQFLALGCAPAGGYNVNGEFTNAFGFGLNGFNRQFDLFVEGADGAKIMTETPTSFKQVKPNAVMMKDNAEMFPFIRYVWEYADKITDTGRALDVIARSLKSPVIVSAPEQLKTAIINAIKAVDDNNIVIVGASGLPIDTIKALDTGADPTRLVQLWEYRENLKGEIRELLGITNNPQSKKKERMIVGELEANDQATNTSIFHRLKYRQKFCDDLNALWGWNVSVKLAEPYENNDEDENEEVTEDDNRENESSDAGE